MRLAAAAASSRASPRTLLPVLRTNSAQSLAEGRLPCGPVSCSSDPRSALSTWRKSPLRNPSWRYAQIVRPMTISGCENSFVWLGMSLPTNGTASSRRDVGTRAPPFASSRVLTSLALSSPYATRLILARTCGSSATSQSLARLIILSDSSSASFSITSAASAAPADRVRYARMWWSATPRAAPCARSQSSAHSARSGVSSREYHARSRSTTCGCDCTPLLAVAAVTHWLIFRKISAASFEPWASSAADRRSFTLKMASRMKKGSFHRKPSPARDFEKSSGTRRPRGQWSSERKGWRMRSTSSRTRVPDCWNSLTISAATAPSFLSSKISPAPSPPASATRSERDRNSLAPSKNRPNPPMWFSTPADSSCAT